MKFTTISQAKKETGLAYLGSINSSAKILKNQKVLGITTYVLYLSPHILSGYNVCPNSTKECRLGCLHTSGRVKMESDKHRPILNARNLKTKLFFEHNEFFMNWLIAEIKTEYNKALNKGFGFAVRLNCTSDIEFEEYKTNGLNIFKIFPDVQFYDYTKISHRLLKDLPKNYNLTLSYTGRNKDICLKHLKNGGNVAMVFNCKIPKKWCGYDVIDGDITDVRFKDKKNSIAGLKWKQIANKEHNEYVKNSVFCIQENDNDCEY